MEKLLLQSEKPSVGLRLLPALGIFPIFDELEKTPQDAVFHPETNCWIHTMMVVDEAAKLVKDLPKAEALTVLLAALAHDFGKASTTTFEDGRVRAHGHAEAGLAPATEFLDALNVYTVDNFDVRSNVLALVEHHLVPPQLFAAKAKDSSTNVPRALRRLSLKVRLDLLALVSLADMLGRGVPEAEKENSKGIIRWFTLSSKDVDVMDKPPEKILMGRHLLSLGVAPGKAMGEILDAAFELQLEGRITNLEEALDWVQKGCINLRESA
jgi:tRNA nucleotidyltransferase (CCA-adding enzyme)